MKRAVLAAALLAALIAGCGRQTDVSRGDQSQVLHRGIVPDIDDLDPHMASQTNYYSVLSALLEGLTAEDPVDLHPVPAVAERWDSTPDGLTYTFYLRADARWSNGEPVTAQDFIGSWRRILSPSLGAADAAQLYVIQGAEAFNRGDGDFSQVGLRARGPRQLEVTLEHPAPWFLSLLSTPAWLPVPLATIRKYGGETQRGVEWTTPERWVGNGPFVLHSWRHGQEIVVERSPTYWDTAHVRLRAIHFHVFDSVDAEDRAFRAGQVHLTEMVPPAKIEAYKRDSPALLREDPLLGTYFVRVNTRRPGLVDARVRLALALAIDRASVTEHVLRGGQRPARAFTPPGLGSYAPAPVQGLDLDKARRLLSEAGHAGGEGIPEFELLFNSDETHRLVAEALQEMWRRDLGISVRLTNEDFKSVEAARSTGSYDLLLSSWIADFEDPTAFLDIWRSDNGNNFTGWADPDYDELLFKAARTTDQSSRLALMGRAETMLLESAPVIPIYHYVHAFLITPSVKGWHPTLLDHHPYKDVYLEP
ncbi:MAG TPA: peptide ABC transporter substrate-binding protein [Opitutaceae bacterium]|jgi:oligopeptide transport system substrate-binding protein